MNNKDKKRTSKMNARKVILLKYKDTRDTFVLTRTVKRRKESLKIVIECNTQPVKEVNRTVTQNEKYPIFRAQLKDRIVPRCTRDKCRRHVQCKTEQCRLRKQRKSHDKAKSLDSKKKKARTPSLIEISDEECDGLQYDDISSESSWSVDEIDALMESTRKRMKDSDEEWKILPRQPNLMKLPKHIIETKRASRSPSLNSLDTFVLDAMEVTEVTTKQKLDVVSSEFKHDTVKRKFTYDSRSRQSLKREECFEANRDEHSSQLNISANSKIANPKKKIKLEPLESNNSRAKRRPDLYYESLPKEGFQTKQETTHRQYNATYLKVESIINQNIIKPEPNNNIINQPNYVTREDEKSIINYKTKNEIDAVITKLEKNDIMDYYGLNLSLTDMKQELYSDI